MPQITPLTVLLLSGRELTVMSSLQAYFVFIAIALSPVLSLADPVKQLAEDYLAKRPITSISSTVTMAEALQIQDQLVSALAPRLGKPVGYKVGLVTKEAQERSGVTNPIRGVLLEKMFFLSHAEFQADFGVRPLVEADLAVIVRDPAINNAAVPLDVLRNLKEIVAFIELPDQLVSTNQRVTGPLLSAMNVGARYGVLGQRAPVRATTAFADALEKMEITMVDGAGKSLGKAPGSMILNHPLNAVIWLIDDLKKAGKELRPGDLISLGSVKAITPDPGQTYTVKYDGLPGGPLSVSVRFK
jgi:2-keto-4-pentenoate hydratase